MNRVTELHSSENTPNSVWITQKEPYTECVLKFVSNTRQKMLQHEIRILRTYSQIDGIIKILGFGLCRRSDTEVSTWVALERALGGDLFDWLINQPTELTDETIHQILSRIVTILQHCHSKRLYHLDLKAENIVLRKPDDLDSIALIDFEGSILLTHGQTYNSLAVQRRIQLTPSYAPPELIMHNSIENKHISAIDSWELGILAYTIAARCHPFQGNTHTELIHSILSGVYEWPDECSFSSQGRKFIQGLLQINPENRTQITKMNANSLWKL